MKVFWLNLVILISCRVLIAQQKPSGAFSLAPAVGYAWSNESEAIKGFKETYFKSTFSYGGSFMYHFFPKNNSTEFHIGISIQNMDMAVEEENQHIGTLRLKPIMFQIGVGKMEYGKGQGYGIAEIILGKYFNDFKNGEFIDSFEKTYGVKVDVKTDEPFVFGLSGEVGYFVFENISPFLRCQLFIGNISTSWNISGGGATATMPNFELFKTLNSSICIGIRYWAFWFYQ